MIASIDRISSCGRVLLMVVVWQTVLEQSPAAEFAAGLTEKQVAEGWISLFDGQTLFGWKKAGDANFQVRDGAITVDSGDVCLLRTTSQFSDYVLRVDFRADPQTNSGIFLRTSPRPGDVQRDCYELNIADPANPFPTGSLVGRVKSDATPTSGQWQTFEARLEGPHVTIRLDGKLVLEYEDPDPIGRGFIGLQHNQGPVAFRNVFLKPLGGAELINGKDLDAWKTYPDMDARFSVTEAGHLQVEGGRGQLESRAQFADFTLQTSCKTLADQVNSGIFFRCQPGLEMMGYECQINNAVVEGDRTRPADCGTGGIFRRQDARRVLGDDHQWVYLTLVVEGPHMASWVNGAQVMDWSDQRKPYENPRKGRRLDAGTLMIQGHDPGTKLLFQSLEVAELTPRRP